MLRDPAWDKLAQALRDLVYEVKTALRNDVKRLYCWLTGAGSDKE